MKNSSKKQEKCTVVGEGYTASEEVTTEIESICSGLENMSSFYSSSANAMT